MMRTHTCGELKSEHAAKMVSLCGWIASRRDHGEIIFIDLRDKHGITQLVFDPAKNKAVHKKAHELRSEYCVKASGTVMPRPEGTVNPKIPTGAIEIEVKEVEVFSKSETVPFEIQDDIEVSEDTRLRYRYLDLRRPIMQEKLKIRHKTFAFIMDFLDKEAFSFIETPMLTKSTPEGARDYLVPSRLKPGSFYALPQSPQLFKQLLMVSGVEKYFQIVRCFRDEDLRADRQPEFTQLDMEMSFVDQEDILGVSERLFKELTFAITGKKIEAPFPRIDYEDALSRYGTDKPDTRFEMHLTDLTDTALKSDFKIFRDAADKGGKIMALAAPGYADKGRSEIDQLTLFAAEYGARGLAYFKVAEDGISSPISKFFSKETLESFREKTGAKPNDMIFMVADTRQIACETLGALRLKIAREKDLIDKEGFNFLWVVNFPLFKFNRDENKWVSEHHPFTSFAEEDMVFLKSGELEKIRAHSYDLVLNGSEIGSGSIRIHNGQVQQKIFDALGLTKRQSLEKFGFLLDAFRYGVPPHGGIAFGIDRILTFFTNDSSIREVIAFPKTQKGTCPLSGAPSEIDERQLRELGLRLK